MKRDLMVGIVLSLALGAAAVQAAGLRARAAGIRLPEVNFRSQPADRAIEQLVESARESDPAGVGVNVVYRGPRGEHAPSVTLMLRQINVLDALRYVAEISGLHMRVDRDAILISSEREPDAPMEIRFYPVSPSLIDVVRESGP